MYLHLSILLTPHYVCRLGLCVVEVVVNVVVSSSGSGWCRGNSSGSGGKERIVTKYIKTAEAMFKSYKVLALITWMQTRMWLISA